MTRTEVVAKRTARSKTFDNGDGTMTLESGNHAHHHHPVTGEFVDTVTEWHDVLARFHVGDAGEHPFLISLVKSTRTLTIDFRDGDTLIIAPKGARVPTSVMLTGNTVTLARLWTGITLKCVLTPEGVALRYVKTATTFVNPSFTVTGDWNAHYGPNVWQNTASEPVAMPQTLVGGVLTYDFATVPVGTVVE